MKKYQLEHTTVTLPTEALDVTGLDTDEEFNIHVRGQAIVLLSDDLTIPEMAQTILGLHGLAAELQNQLGQTCRVFDYNDYDFCFDGFADFVDDDDTPDDDDNEEEISATVGGCPEDIEKLRQALENMANCLDLLSQLIAGEEYEDD